MRKKNWRAWIIIIVFLMTACQPDPRKEAEAYKTTTEADSEAAKEAEYLRFQKQMNDIHVHDAQQEQIAKDAAIEERKKATKTFIAWVGFVLTIGACAGIVILVYSGARVAHGTAIAANQAADLRSRLIYADKDTGLFPLIVQPISNNRIAFHNPNDGSLLITDASKEPNQQKITTSGYLTTAAVLARAGAKSGDAKGIAQIDPAVIHPQVIDEQGVSYEEVDTTNSTNS